VDGALVSNAPVHRRADWRAVARPVLCSQPIHQPASHECRRWDVCGRSLQITRGGGRVARGGVEEFARRIEVPKKGGG
jgi:hypothetical protein